MERLTLEKLLEVPGLQNPEWSIGEATTSLAIVWGDGHLFSP